MQMLRWPVVRLCLAAFAAGLLLASCNRGGDQTVLTASADHPFTPPEMVVVSSEADIEPLFRAMAGRRFVLLGESTHGTHEYYRWRDRISRRLIRDMGFQFVAVEGDWAAFFLLNQYVKHLTPDELDLPTLLDGLDRWPRWMWANKEFAELLEWLRETNASRPLARRIGVYGLDMQNPQASMDAVVQWFEANDPGMAVEVKDRYRAVHGVPDGFRRYAQSLARGGQRLDSDFAHVAERLKERHADAPDDPLLFSAKMNALAVVSAEAQHHAMTQRGPESWNVRARFKDKAFRKLADWYGDESRGIVWAHNTHVGDALATEMRDRGEVNIGQLLRQRFGSEHVYILGFATARGTVLAGAEWGGAMETMSIVPPREGSLEAMLQARGLEQALFFFDPDRESREWTTPIPHRAIGVVYRPPHEAYVMTIPAQRYDALFYIRETSALSPL